MKLKFQDATAASIKSSGFLPVLVAWGTFLNSTKLAANLLYHPPGVEIFGTFVVCDTNLFLRQNLRLLCALVPVFLAARGQVVSAPTAVNLVSVCLFLWTYGKFIVLGRTFFMTSQQIQLCGFGCCLLTKCYSQKNFWNNGVCFQGLKHNVIDQHCLVLLYDIMCGSTNIDAIVENRETHKGCLERIYTKMTSFWLRTWGKLNKLHSFVCQKKQNGSKWPPMSG